MSRVPKSLKLYQQAQKLIAGRTHLFSRRAELHAYGVSPIYSEKQEDGYIWDVDGNKYLDFNLGTGAVLLGHAYPAVVKAVREQAGRGTGLTLNHPLELEVAELMTQIVPCAEMVRFCKGGGEANMVAVRIARANTGRDKVAFCGYHGWHDWYLAANLSSSTNLEKHLLPGISTAGVPRSLEGTAFPFEYNNLESLKRVLDSNAGEIACVIMEAARTFTPAEGFLEGVKSLTQEHNVVLIFDEVVTGFRTSLGGAQELYKVIPDIATYAKSLANGNALGAIAGKREVMEVALNSFISSVYWAEATGLAAAKATLEEYLAGDVAKSVWQFGEEFIKEAGAVINQIGIPVFIAGLPPFPAFVFNVAKEQIDQVVTLYMQEIARRGVYGGPGHFFCYKHTTEDLSTGISTIGEAFEVVNKALSEGDILKYLECPVRQSSFQRLV